ncbi:uncharacterized protein LOC124386269 [Silurus meridionalis]|uniref:uncharacterized protein LOC124386269 n=1 Tax=Silurus meridionalis TaxID=175797 RepID=UPI001EEB8FF2|nr:uncharacterized protein LOC124386269 [Silurus meridionalis]
MKTSVWITVMLFNLSSAQIYEITQPNPMISADVGDSVILHCFKQQEETTGTIIWYKQKVGHEPRVMVTVQHKPSYEDEFKSPRFSIEREKSGCHLNIAHVEATDEAMYYCGLRKFLTHFGKGTYLSVKGDGGVKVLVNQSSVSDSVPAGASVTLQCSVLSESRAAELQVLWFRAAPSQSHPQLIYTHHNSSLQCESESSTHTCVYNLSKNIFSLNDTGTYYCAVVLCGKIIFGNGTRVQLKNSLDPAVFFLAVASGVCLVVIIVYVLSCKARNCEHCSGRSHASMLKKTPTQSRDAMKQNFAATHIIKGKGKRERAHDNVYTEVIYSTVS